MSGDPESRVEQLTIEFSDQAEYPVLAVCMADGDAAATHALIEHHGRGVLVPLPEVQDPDIRWIKVPHTSSGLDDAPTVSEFLAQSELHVTAEDLLRSDDAFSVRGKRSPLPPRVRYLRR